MKRLMMTLAAAFVCIMSFAAAQRDTVRILAIGNSFSEDAVEQHLYDLAKEEGVPVIIGNMYIGGCSLERHVNNARNDAPAYRYRKISADGKMQQVKEFSLSRALKDDNWDYVSVQQASPVSGQPESYDPWLDELVGYVESFVPDAEIVFHMTWAYDKDYDHKKFATYGYDQLTMYNAILKTVRQQTARIGIRTVIPAGTSVQNARTTVLVDKMTRDGYHMSKPHGRYLVACTWVEKILGCNVKGNPYCPEGMTAEECRLAQKAAHTAVRKPFKISKIK
jgi:hypothetical protein